MRLKNLCLILTLACASCETTPALISGGIAGGLLAINEMLADGTITLDQHSKLTEAFNASKDALVAVTTTVDMVKKAQEGTLTTEEAMGGGAGIAGLVATLMALFQQRKKKAPKPVPAGAAD